jgi:hypothetical protein
MLITAQIAIFSALAAAVLALLPKRFITVAKFSSCSLLFLSGLIAVYAGASALIGGKIFSWYFLALQNRFFSGIFPCNNWSYYDVCCYLRARIFA